MNDPNVIRILLVDDDARNLDVLESILEDPSYRFLRAQDADTALRLLLEHDVAAIVLDIKMPGVSGFELAQLIKGTRKFRQIPILFLTAYMIEERDILAGYGTGAVDYLTKPVNPVIIRHKVAVFADLFRKTRALAELNDRLEQRVRERTAELQRSETALREANAQKDRFLATLAHELRNPLAPIRTGVDVLLRHPERPANMDRVLSTMNRQVDHMVRLLDDLLDVSRITRGHIEVKKEPVELLSVVQPAIEMTSPLLARRGQTIAFDWGDAPRKACVDAARITQIVANLLNNASKHSPSGSRITIRARSAGTNVVVEIIDEGTGIPAEQLSRVFDMFAKIDRKTEVPNDGLGIGLALSRSLAELHGGTLTASSEGEGRGSTFTLTVPVGEGAGADAFGVSATPPRPAAPPADRKLKIVVVEDNADSAEMLASWLELLGHDPIVARNGPDGVALIKQASPDLVLCDIGLPGMDGVEVCREIMTHMPAPPVMVALTGWGAEEDRARTKDAGFRMHLVKPVDPEKLGALLQSLRAQGAAAVA